MDTSNGHFTIRYLAESDAISEGVNKIYLRQRIDKHRLGSSTWTPVATIPVDTKQSMASYIEEGARCATNNIIPSVSHYDDNHLYLGSMDGAIHDLSLFNIYRDVNDAAATKYQAKDNYVYGLANYWPLKEGHGHVAADTRHTHDFEVNDSWMLENENYSLRLDDNKGVEADISRINTSVGDSYAIEMWVHASNPDSDGDEQIVFEAGSVPSNRLELYINNQDDWLLRYGNNEQVVVSHEDFPYMPTWAHVALNVVRGQAASFYFNGERTAVIAERDVPPLEGARLTMGRGMGTLSQIDEVRVWHAALSENRLLSNMYNCIDTTDVYSRGLVAYYPFEKAGTVDGVATKVPYTLYNMPEWLSLVDSERTDDISPLKTKTLRFAVSPLTPVGCYDFTIGLQGNNAILEPLRIVLKVQSEQPAWTVDPTAYENSMTIVAQVYLDGHLMENGESIVAAFIDGECRGIASPVKERGAAFVDGECRGASRSDGGLYYLLIAGEGSGTPIELRTCIDGQIVSIDNKLTFSTDANIGTPWNPYVIDLTGVQAIQDVRYSGSGSVETLYDLQGRKMDSRKLRQGVYIRNGKKLVVGDRSSIEE